MEYLKLSKAVVLSMLLALCWLSAKLLSILLWKSADVVVFAGGWLSSASADMYVRLEKEVEDLREASNDLNKGDDLQGPV